MIKKYYLLLPVFLFSLAISAQSGKQKRADRLYEDFAYAKAIDLYKELVGENYNITYNQQKLGDSYYELRNPEKAVEYYEKIVADSSISPEVYFRYAQMLRGIREYEESRMWLEKYHEEASNPKPVEEFVDPDQIATYQGLETFRLQPVDFNSGNSDFGTFTQNGVTYFVSARGTSDTKSKIFEWTGEPFLDVYKTTDGSDVTAIPGDVNTVRHEGPLSLSADGKTMYFTRNNYLNNKNGKEDEEGINHLKIYKASLEEDGEWDDIEELPFNSNTYSVGHPALSPDGEYLYFVSEAPGGQGGSDLYRVKIEGDTYGTPENLGPDVNTAGNEVFPFVNSEGDLFFSSDGHPGYGLLDIFILPKEDNSKVLNLGQPVNSSLDDFSYSSTTEEKGYISSNRTGGMGGDDIYDLNILAPLVLKGVVTDSINGKPIENASLRILNENNEQIFFLETDSEGYYETEVARDKVYPVEVKHIKYNSENQEINTSNMDNQKELVQNFELSPIEDVEYLAEIDKIYFDFDKATIRPDAAAELDKLVNLMLNEYPDLVIEVGSHTDVRGSVAYNEKLAERRAKATYDYLVEHGVQPERILRYQGYGESDPAVECSDCTEKQHQLNRRSIFKVVKME